MKITKVQVILIIILAIFVLALPGQVFAGKFGGTNSKSFLARQAKPVTPPVKPNRPATPPVKKEKPKPPKQPVTPPARAGQSH